jgi:ankyrin repeat protein
VAGSGEGASRRVEWNAVVHAAHNHKTHPALLEYLVERGCELNAREAGQTALHVLARRGDAAGVRLLLDKGASPTMTDSKGRLPVDVTRNQRVLDLLTSRDKTHDR